MGRRCMYRRLRAELLVDRGPDVAHRGARRVHLPRSVRHVDADGAFDPVLVPVDHIAIGGARFHEAIRVAGVAGSLASAEAGHIAREPRGARRRIDTPRSRLRTVAAAHNSGRELAAASPACAAPAWPRLRPSRPPSDQVRRVSACPWHCLKVTQPTSSRATTESSATTRARRTRGSATTTATHTSGLSVFRAGSGAGRPGPFRDVFLGMFPLHAATPTRAPDAGPRPCRSQAPKNHFYLTVFLAQPFRRTAVSGTNGGSMLSGTGVSRLTGRCARMLSNLE